jgi:hypothetical protein
LKVRYNIKCYVLNLTSFDRLHAFSKLNKFNKKLFVDQTLFRIFKHFIKAERLVLNYLKGKIKFKNQKTLLANKNYQAKNNKEA